MKVMALARLRRRCWSESEAGKKDIIYTIWRKKCMADCAGNKNTIGLPMHVLFCWVNNVALNYHPFYFCS